MANTIILIILSLLLIDLLDRYILMSSLFLVLFPFIVLLNGDCSGLMGTAFLLDHTAWPCTGSFFFPYTLISGNSRKTCNLPRNAVCCQL